MPFSRRFTAFLLAAALLGVATACSTQRIGLIGNDALTAVTTFDPNTSATQGNVNVSSRGGRDVYALAIGPLGNQAYVSDRSGTIRRVTLSGSAPSLAGAAITPSNTASDLASVENNFLMLIAIGTDPAFAGSEGIMSTINLADGSELDTFDFGDTIPYSVDVCDDSETVLVGTAAPQAVHKFTVNNRGELSRTGSTFSARHPVANVYCAPGSQTGIAVSSVGATMQSFDVGSMGGIDTRNLAGQSATPVGSQPIGLSGVFAPSGNRFFVRSERGDFGGNGFVEAFSVDATTGALGASALQQTSVAPLASASRGTDEIAISADGNRLYVTDRNNDRVLVLNPSTLSTITTISGTDIDAPFSIVIGGSN